MKIKKITYPSPDEHYNKQLFHVKSGQGEFRFGTVFLKKGTRIPEKGFTKHPDHEISMVQEGKIEMLNEDGSVKGYLKTGDMVHIEALEPQAGHVLEDTKIVYALMRFET